MTATFKPSKKNVPPADNRLPIDTRQASPTKPASDGSGDIDDASMVDPQDLAQAIIEMEFPWISSKN